MSVRLFPLVAATVCALLLLAYSDSRAADLIEGCNSDDPDTEIECLRQVIRQLTGSDRIANEVQVAPAAKADADASTTSVLRSESEEAGRANEQDQNLLAPDLQQAEGASASHETKSSTVAVRPRGLGAEQVAARMEKARNRDPESKPDDEENAEAHSYVVDFAHTSSGRLVVVLANGQVWAQRSGDSTEVRLRDNEESPVTIRRGRLSGYRLDFTDKHRTITAERLR